MFIYDIEINIVSLYYKKSTPLDTIEISIICLPFFLVKNWLTYIQVIGLLIDDVYQNSSNNLNERNFLTLSVIFFSIDGIPEKLSLHFRVRLPLHLHNLNLKYD